jgi:hypothetical protein
MADEYQPILDYTARDFDSIRSLLVGIASGKMPEWTTVGEANDFGTLLLELYAYMGDVTNYYIDRVGSEAFLGTAQRRQSVLYMAEMFGYSPMGRKAATSVVQFSLDDAYVSDDPNNPENILTIPSGTVVATTEKADQAVVYFETDSSITIRPGESGAREVTVTEGRTVLDEYVTTSRGIPNSEYTLSRKDIVEGSVVLRTKEGPLNYEFSPEYVQWTEIDSISTALLRQNAFSTYLDDSGYTHIVFGDNTTGRVVPVGGEIYVSYRYGVGSAGNGITRGSINVIEDTTLPTAYLSVTNTLESFGGSDQETIDDMRFSIPLANKVRNRAVTLEDFTSLAVQVPQVGNAVAYGEVYTAVNVRIAPVNGMLNAEGMSILRNKVYNYLSDKIMLGTKVYIEDFEWEDVWIALDLHVLSGFDKDTVTSNVKSSIENLLSYSNRTFGGKVSIGDIYRVSMKIEGVDYIDVTELSNGVTRGSLGNVIVDDLKIARIHPEGSSEDPYGLNITTYGGSTNA